MFFLLSDGNPAIGADDGDDGDGDGGGPGPGLPPAHLNLLPAVVDAGTLLLLAAKNVKKKLNEIKI